MRKGQGRGGTKVASKSHDRVALLLSVAVTVAADQVSKILAVNVLAPDRRVDLLGSFLGLELVRNPGGAFSILRDRSVILTLATAVAVMFVTVWAYRSRESPVPFGMIVGGGIGNLADRIFRSPGFPDGLVVDFIDISFWPTFNVADTAITIGVGLLLLRAFGRPNPRSK